MRLSELILRLLTTLTRAVSVLWLTINPDSRWLHGRYIFKCWYTTFSTICLRDGICEIKIKRHQFIYLFFFFYHLEGIGCREHTAEFNCCSTFCISLHWTRTKLERVLVTWHWEEEEWSHPSAEEATILFRISKIYIFMYNAIHHTYMGTWSSVGIGLRGLISLYIVLKRDWLI